MASKSGKVKGDVDATGERHGYYDSHLTVHAEDKRRVAREVVGKVLSGDSLALDAGTSATAVARALFDSELTNLSILTHNMEVFLMYGLVTGTRPSPAWRISAEHGHQLLLTGGCFDPDYKALYGPLTEAAYERFYPRVSILAVSGLTAARDHAGGLFCHAVVEANVKARLLAIPAERRIVIADASKLGRIDSHRFGEVQDLKKNLVGTGDAYIITTRPTGAGDELRRYEDLVENLRSLYKVDVIEVRPGAASASDAGGTESPARVVRRSRRRR
jgi:DeoR/GlpR family transcriptional regulator of sugar metabolism